MLKVGVIGLGTMGTVHAAAYRALPQAELTAVCDVSPEAVERVAASGGPDAPVVKRYSSVEEIVADRELDVIDVCLPTYLHVSVVQMAAQAGKHVFCEKPLARTLDEAHAMVDACKSAGVQLGVGHVVRFFPEYMLAKEQVDAGALGRIGTVRTARGGAAFPIGWDDWYANFSYSGGVILDLMIHEFDFLRWCFGDVARVHAKSTRTRQYGRLEYALVTLRFRSGAIAHVEGSWVRSGQFSTRYEIAGSKGMLTHDSRESAPVRVVRHAASGDAAGGVAVPESPVAINPYTREIAHFVEALEAGQKPMIDGEEGLRALEISLAALESLETNAPVVLAG